MATTTPPLRGEDAPTVEELILELSECPLAAETEGVARADAIDEIIAMCRAYIVSSEGRRVAAHIYNKRRH